MHDRLFSLFFLRLEESTNYLVCRIYIIHPISSTCFFLDYFIKKFKFELTTTYFIFKIFNLIFISRFFPDYFIKNKNRKNTNYSFLT